MAAEGWALTKTEVVGEALTLTPALKQHVLAH